MTALAIIFAVAGVLTLLFLVLLTAVKLSESRARRDARIERRAVRCALIDAGRCMVAASRWFAEDSSAAEALRAYGRELENGDAVAPDPTYIRIRWRENRPPRLTSENPHKPQVP
ncbi:MAG: hypothetical protein H0W83_14005 [Planctomycetes bacterium]|nr:hypothetical protein [Planctomycetota bacterium]